MGFRKKGPVFSNKDIPSDDDFDKNDVEISEPESDFETDSESENEGEDIKLTEPSKTAIYNKDGLLDKLNDISWPNKVEFVHKLSFDISQAQEVDVNDDLARELAFYTQALEGARQAFVKFESMKVPFLRPSDYYAEMVKTDTHMVKVKSRLLAEKRKIEEAEERRKARDSKKIAKEVQAQKTRDRAKQKKEEIESVKKWRKQRQQNGFVKDGKDGEEMGFDFSNEKTFERSNKKRPWVGPGDRSGGKGKFGGGNKGKFGAGNKGKFKGEKKDSKFGFGGRKGMKKQNTAESTNEMKGFKKSDTSANKKRKR